MIRITQLVVLGDSLSDRGTLYKHMLLGILPMNFLSGLSKKSSPKDRFTNGYLWGDYVSAAIVERFEISDQRRRLKLNHTASDNADVSDEFLSNPVVREQNRSAFNLNDDKYVLFKGNRFARFYCEGGLASHDYSTYLSTNTIIEASRLISATLEKKREELLSYDKKNQISKQDKAETLVIEWSGANDLIAVNEEPTYQAVDNAIRERIKNIELLIENGYRNFILFNLPNLSLTPRYQVKEKLDNASKCSKYFNERLAQQCAEINKKYKELNISITLSVFDVNKAFENVYDNPESYRFEREKLKKPYIESEEFKINKKNPDFIAGKILPAPGYMFWDDVHPTMTMHHWIAVQFIEKYRRLYDFIAPQQPYKKTTKDDLNITKKSSLSDDNSKLIAALKLPKDVNEILIKLHRKMQIKCKSNDSSYQKKGFLLKQLLLDLKCQNGDLKKMYEVISSFIKVINNMEVIKEHYRPLCDFFALKTTTSSEDLINSLVNAIKTHLSTRNPGDCESGVENRKTNLYCGKK